LKVIVVGAGIVGALTAYRLAQAGAAVTVIDAGQPAGAASGASFGWINASFFLNRAHFDLRARAINAHRRMGDDLGTRAYQWTGALCWEEVGAAFDTQRDDLHALGYTVTEIDRPRFQALEPAVRAPERALLFQSEGAVDLPVLTQEALSAATSLGARVLCGVEVRGLFVAAGRIAGVDWSGGRMDADRVVLATGVGTQRLLTQVDVTLPMVPRPGLILQTEQMPPLVSHILASPEQELRQLPDGRFLAPCAAGHQTDETEAITSDIAAVAEAAAARVSALLQRKVRWSNVRLADRPVPKDGLPVMGACGPEGLYVSTMHSGATLAPIAAEIAAAELLDKPLSQSDAALMASFRPHRFTA
jgi:glycine/D-amino acid oxidase-like deaminating enzyme